MLGCSYESDSGDNITNMNGVAGTFMEGFVLNYSTYQDANHSIDVLSAGSGQLLLQSQTGQGRVVGHIGANYRAISSSTLIGAILTQDEMNKNTVMGKFIHFLLNRGVVEGTVNNEQGNPISGATISAGLYSTVSNVNGLYSLVLPAGENYTITCTHPSFDDYTHSNTIDILAAMNTSVDIVMTGNSITNSYSLAGKNHFGISNFPNPFNPHTTLSFAINKADFTTLEIYNIKGELIRSLYEGYLEQGSHSFIWDGKDKNGSTQSSGIYFTRLKSGNVENTKKIVMIK